ncbi:MAG: response regulator [Verrucomicrobia bacterium]|nr:response regulator [Verrucomicrobiota bacterium]
MSTAPKTRILFVDDERSVLQMLALMLRAINHECTGTFVESGAQALAVLAQEPFDIVFTDMRMPGMNGAQLLNEVMKRYPRTIRIVLTGYAEDRAVMECIGATHQWLLKPCDVTVLKTLLARLRTLNLRLQREDICSLVGGLTCLPSLPAVYQRMLEAVHSPGTPVEVIGEIVAQDLALSAKLLQLVNSAFFGFAREVATPAEAVQLLGVSRILSLTLATHIFSALDPTLDPSLGVQEIWEHSLRTAVLARSIVRAEAGDANLQDLAFTGGLLHDAGKLIFAANFPDRYRTVLTQARTSHRPLPEVENERFGATHADLGGYLLGIWGLPVALVEAVTFHHQPAAAAATTFSALTAVHVADALDQEAQPDPSCPWPVQLDLGHLDALGLQERPTHWRAFIESRRAPPPR